MTAYTRLVRPLLFRLPADQAHDLVQAALGWTAPWRLLGSALPPPDARLATTLCSVPLRSPIGLAAGFDKNADCVPALSALGFGFLTLGSIMTEVRPGNPRPRLARVVRRQGLTNALGLPSKGRVYALARLRRLRARPVPIIANVCGFSPTELAEATAALQPHVDAVEIGLICPHAGDQGGLGTLATFAALVEALVAVRRVPVLIKLPPHRAPGEDALVREMVRLCLEGGIDGVTVGGGRLVADRRLAVGRGSLSGRPILRDTLRLTADVAEWSGGHLAIKAGGGIFSGQDALAVLQAGASAVEIYTAFVYRGPTAAAAIGRELAAALDRAGLPGLAGTRRVPVPVAR